MKYDDILKAKYINLTFHTGIIFWLVDPIYWTPPLGQDMTLGQFLSGV